MKNFVPEGIDSASDYTKSQSCLWPPLQQALLVCRLRRHFDVRRLRRAGRLHVVWIAGPSTCGAQHGPPYQHLRGRIANRPSRYDHRAAAAALDSSGDGGRRAGALLAGVLLGALPLPRVRRTRARREGDQAAVAAGGTSCSHPAEVRSRGVVKSSGATELWSCSERLFGCLRSSTVVSTVIELIFETTLFDRPWRHPGRRRRDSLQGIALAVDDGYNAVGRDAADAYADAHAASGSVACE